jgi:hypothetical protein
MVGQPKNGGLLALTVAVVWQKIASPPFPSGPLAGILRAGRTSGKGGPSRFLPPLHDILHPASGSDAPPDTGLGRLVLAMKLFAG